MIDNARDLAADIGMMIEDIIETASDDDDYEGYADTGEITTADGRAMLTIIMVNGDRFQMTIEKMS